jgi:hypothetical protein
MCAQKKRNNLSEVTCITNRRNQRKAQKTSHTTQTLWTGSFNSCL